MSMSLRKRVKELEEKVKLLEFLQDNNKGDIIIESKLNDISPCRVNWYAKYVDYDKRVQELLVTYCTIENVGLMSIDVVRHENKPFAYIEVRACGVLTQVYKLDHFLNKLWKIDTELYMEAYNVRLNAEENNGAKRNTRKVDDVA